MHAKFNAAEAANMWAMSAGTLRELTEQHVSTGADLLDIHGDEDNVMFTYYTEGALVDNGMFLSSWSCQDDHKFTPFFFF